MATAYQWSGAENLGAEVFRRPETAKPQLVSGARRTAKSATVEFYTVKRIDNSRLVRNVEPVKMRNLYKTVALGGVIAAFCMFYIYQHFRCIDQSFQLEDLKAKTMQAQTLNSKLKLEIAYLRDPQRIDVIARRELGLTQPTANQMREYSNIAGSEVAAMQYARPNHAP
jgi:cell division protein FtsL